MALDMQIQSIIGDVARSNLFECDILLMGEDFKFRCKGASLPAANVGSIAIDYMNRSINYPGDRTYEDWTITVYNDADQVTRRRFIEWQNLIQSFGSQMTGALPSEIKAIAQVRQFDRAGNVTAEFTITGCFPDKIGEIALAWGTDSKAEEFPVTLKIDWWEPTV